MAIEDVTPTYVDLVTHNKYTSRTADATEFAALKDMQSVYLNSSIESLPDKKYTHALALLIAHYYALDTSTAPDLGNLGDDLNQGSVASESVGEVSVSYGGNLPSFESLAGWKAWLSKTVYGQELIGLLKTTRPTPIVTG